jgi:hypothetical protein
VPNSLKTTGVNVIKLFTVVIYDLSQIATVLSLATFSRLF